MRKALAAAVLSTVAGFGILSAASSLLAADATPVAVAAAPAGGAAGASARDAKDGKDQAGVPVRQVVLFSSGVGYFEHFGTVQGDGSTELRFKSAQINDILKSLVLQDLDKGRVTAITYPSQDPVAKTLRSFQVDITNNPALHDLLNQLRGAKVIVVSGAERASGVVLGVEKKQKPAGGKDEPKLVDNWVLNLLVGAGIRPVSLDDVRSLEFEDPELRQELEKALQALASARDQDKKPVTINFQGRGERRIRIGYVVETPVWKTSYRLLLEGDQVAGGAGDKKDEKKDAKPDGAGGATGAGAGAGAAGAGPAGAAGAAPNAAGGSLQGWAIVENQTDNDWNDVQLSLVSGRPISFIQDLYQPLYVPRPFVQPELYASLRPQTYDAGMEPGMAPGKFAAAATPPPAPTAAAPAGAGGGQGGFGARRANELRKAGAESAAGELSDRAGLLERERQSLGVMDAAASVASVASAAKVGGYFQYTVGSVSLPRQKSAMIPIVTDAVEVEKLSIYNQAVLPKNPLYGARVKNTTGKHLLQGPVTVLQGGSYAGDARIDDLPPGQERLISYGIDQQVLVQAQNANQVSAIQTGKIVKGVLHVTRKVTASQEYLAESKAEKPKTLIIEHARRQGWKLIEPAKAAETTDALYRFKDSLEPAKPKKLTVKEEVVTGDTIAILPTDVGQLDYYSRTGEIPKEVRDALIKAIQLKGALTESERQIQQRQQKSAQISQEQQRLRENMKTVAPTSEYYARLVKKLDEQETQIEKLQKEVEGLQKELEQQRKALEEYLGGLNVG